MADEFIHLDLLANETGSRDLLKHFDLILPTTENAQTLAWLNENAPRCNTPLALDLGAYAISSSKLQSNRLFRRAGITMPSPWPECGFPVIVKPSNSSGSTGVLKVDSRAELDRVVAQQRDDLVIQQYLKGPSYSLEVLADKGNSVGLQITELEFDMGYDCKRVLAGPTIGTHCVNAIHRISAKIARELSLSGIMDVEFIDTGSGLQVLEIDARLPSQTPNAVYYSSGINMVSVLADYWIGGKLPLLDPRTMDSRGVIHEHYAMSDGILAVSGEHMLRNAQDLKFYSGVFMTAAFISNFESLKDNWVATAIFTGNNETQAWNARHSSIQEICRTFKCKKFLDRSPFD